MNKKAQSQIITTVLIILLVLAAIVIVWQVVKGTVQGGADEITSQTQCINVQMSVTRIGTTNTFAIKRSAGGGILTGAEAIIIDDGSTVTLSTNINMSGSNNFEDPLHSEVFSTDTAPTTSVEAALALADGTVCPNTGIWEA